MDETHQGAKQIAVASEWFVRAVANNDRSRGRHFGLSGASGCGKTHAARAIYRAVRVMGVDIIIAQSLSHWAALWIDWPNVAEMDDEDDFKDVRYEIERATFIVIDDVGSESDRFKNGVSASRLRRVLSMVESKWVVVTSNLSMEGLLDCYDARNADRLRAYQWVQVGDVPSYRPKLKNSLPPRQQQA